MIKEEALKRIKEYLTDYLSADCYEELEEIMEALEQKSCDKCAYYDNGANDEACAGCFEDYKHPNFKSKEGMTAWWVKYCAPICGEQHYQCTSCGYCINFGQWGKVYTREFRYCPNCGIRMVEPPESEDKK